jgi:hypothetical protein
MIVSAATKKQTGEVRLIGVAKATIRGNIIRIKLFIATKLQKAII